MFCLTDVQAGRREIWAARSAFFESGFAMATWASMIPFLKSHLGIGADVLGMLILCIGLAACSAMPLSGIFLRYTGCRKAISLATVLLMGILAAVPHLSSAASAAAALLAMGAALGLLDVGMNLNAVVIERASGKILMPQMHGFYSIGAFVGAGGFAALAGSGLPPEAAAGIHAGVMALLAICFYPYLLPFRGEGKKKKWTRPRGLVLLLGGMACLGFLSDGAVMDWGGVLLHEGKGVDVALSSLGFTVFSLMQLAGRLCGGLLIRSLGERTVVWGGTVLTAGCFTGIVLCEEIYGLLFFFALAGLCLSNVIPSFYTWIGKQNETPLAEAVTAVTFMGYSGLILGPSVLGFLASSAGISAVFELCALLLMGLSGAVWYVLRR